LFYDTALQEFHDDGGQFRLVDHLAIIWYRCYRWRIGWYVCAGLLTVEERDALLARLEGAENEASVRANMLRYMAFATAGDEFGDAQLGLDKLKARADGAEARLAQVTAE